MEKGAFMVAPDFQSDDNPTLLELLAVDAPKEMQGRSLLGL